jgi:protein TonB
MRRGAVSLMLSVAAHALALSLVGAPMDANPKAPAMRVALREVPKPAQTSPGPAAKEPGLEPTKQPEKPKKPEPVRKKPDATKPTKQVAPITRAKAEKSEPQKEPREASPTAAQSETPALTGNTESAAPAVTGSGASTAGPSVVDVENLTVKKKVQPTYPMLSRKRGDQGTVTLLVTIVSGGVKSVKVEKTSGHAPLDDSAVQAVKGWRFDASGLGDTITARIPFKFELR